MARRKVTAAPVLADWAAVDGALRDIRECEHALTELGADVEAYVDAHRVELSGKSRKMNFGVVGYRISSKLVLPTAKTAEAIATLKALGRTEFVRTTETLDRAALLRQPAEFLEQIDAYVRQRDEFYYDTTDEEPELT